MRGGQVNPGGRYYSPPEDDDVLNAFAPIHELLAVAQQRVDDSGCTYPSKAAWRAMLEKKELLASGEVHHR